MTSTYDFIVIGAGIVGAATAYRLKQRFPTSKIAVLEKENKPAAHQTGHNSGVLHSGLYYDPTTKRAKLCVKGIKQLAEFAEENDVPYDICGKIVVATEEEELPRLQKIYQRGLENGLSEIKIIDKKEIREIEPYCEGVQAIYVPYSGIIDYPEATRKMLKFVGENNVFYDFEVTAISSSEGIHEVVSKKGKKIRGKYLVACGGLQSDRLAKLHGIPVRHRIIGFRGDYYMLTDDAKHKVKNLIYPVPNPKFPFLGVHFTRMTDGEIECGPNAVFVFKREGYGKTDFDLKDTFDALSYKGTWIFFAKHWKFGIDEYRRAFSKKLFYERVRPMIPSLKMQELRPGRSGVRAMALSPDGKLIDEFLFAKKKNALHVLNAPSPAATASLAIGEYIVEEMIKDFNLE